jgi:biopolymer transport protein ExbD/biopolymer transport protein TolR
MEKKKAADPVADINVTPMVDVMLVLLIIFIVVTPMLSKGITVEMAKTNNPIEMQNADKEDAVLIAIARDGRTYLGTDQVAPDVLPNKVKDLLTNKLDKTVFIRADARARYERVVEVIDNLRTAGVDQLGMLTEQIQEKSTQPAAQRPAAGV